MAFDPSVIVLDEVGPPTPYMWSMNKRLRWSGPFRGTVRQLDAPDAANVPFRTDLASVPRSFTWLFPRYGRYTKAAVVHDFLCQNFNGTVLAAPNTPSVALADRSDADEIFLVLMKELEVPWLRRHLMWGAVSWATMITALVPGITKHRLSGWIGRLIVLTTLIGSVIALVVDRDAISIAAVAVALPLSILIGGVVALRRADRLLPYLFAFVLTIVLSPLLAIGIVLGIALYGYLLVEDLLSGLPAIRKFLRDLFSEQAKIEKLGTPQFARLAAVMQGS